MKPLGSRLEQQEALGILLDAARRVVTELADDPLFRRLVNVFGRMPSEDREVILSVLEREVDVRLATRAKQGTAGLRRTHPNPRARLYVRVFGSGRHAR